MKKQRPSKDSRAPEPVDYDRVRDPLRRSWSDWRVTPEEATSSLRSLQGAESGSVSDAVDRLREEGYLDVLIDKLPAEEFDTVSADILGSLSREEQGRWMTAMGDEAFAALLDGSSDSEIQSFDAGDLEVFDRRLAVATTKLERRTAALLAQYGETAVPGESDADVAAREHRVARRDAIVANSAAESEAELNRIRETMAGGFTDLDFLFERFEHAMVPEFEAEFEFGLPLTSARDAGGRGQWRKGHVEYAVDTLRELPTAHVRDNPALGQIHRKQEREGRPRVLGDYHRGTGTMRMFDLGMRDAEVAFQVMAHEVGHSVHNGDAALWRRFLEETGTSTRDGLGTLDAMTEDGTAEHVAAETVNHLAHAGDAMVPLGEHEYRLNRYGRGFNRFERGLIPQDGELDWAYASSSPSELFAEMYSHSVTNPLDLYRDLVYDPYVESEERAGRVTAAREAGADDATIARLQIQADRASEVARKRAGLRDFFRSDVFDVDDSAIQSAVAGPGQEEELERRQAGASFSMTQAQVDRVSGGGPLVEPRVFRPPILPWP